MSIHDLLVPNPYNLFANTISVASGVIPPPSSAPVFTVGPPGPLTVNGTTILNGPLNMTGAATIFGTLGTTGQIVSNGYLNNGNSLIVGDESVQGDFSVQGNITGVTGSTTLDGPIILNGATTANNNIVITPPSQLIGRVFYDNTLVVPNNLFNIGITRVQEAIDRMQAYSPRAFAVANKTPGVTPLSAADTSVPTTFAPLSSRPNPSAPYWVTPGTANGIQGSFASFGPTVVYNVTALVEVTGPFTQTTVTGPFPFLLPYPNGVNVTINVNNVPQISSFAAWDQLSASPFHASASGSIVTSANSFFDVSVSGIMGVGVAVTSVILYVEYDGNI